MYQGLSYTEWASLAVALYSILHARGIRLPVLDQIFDILQGKQPNQPVTPVGSK